MKRIVLLLSLTLSGLLAAQDPPPHTRFSASFGIDVISRQWPNTHFDNLGVYADFYIPLDMLAKNLYYKGAMVYHGMNDNDHYVHAINALQLQARAKLKNMDLIFFYGVGLDVEYVYGYGNSSFGSFVIDVSCLLYQSDWAGLKFNYLYQFLDGYLQAGDGAHLFQLGITVRK